ncbi:hypothetical protein [Sporomusa sphaeroides]|uniref:Uncharacterized protein n=1 Tax=Sporomusa sphaeroides DSM 2875 TaxID=1337886 RepID=A0A1U7M9U9_9FIRM|nr:hypothetical protein [Sporomusa sphaeroides]OLS54331.1 hypothetical protein SPSPH_45770 [Sporomusa sphaeroides DSM 2875]CVK21560.1 hypothetical protein SSPH_04252 [Sporomusa sphaeroides DSM 2875]
MKKGDTVYTPRFCTVVITEVYEDPCKAFQEGYKEPTHYAKDPEYEILGKNIGDNRMAFAAIRK